MWTCIKCSGLSEDPLDGQCPICGTELRINKEEFLKNLTRKLERHDWTFRMSDDFSVWSSGNVQREDILFQLEVAEKGGFGLEAKALYDFYSRR